MAEAEAQAADELAARLKISPIIAQILVNRGLRDPQACQDFLRPSLKSLYDPAKIPNLTKAADRIARAIRDQERIVIYGDYDVDGITASAILWHAIRVLGGQADYYVPHRIDEGYGLNSEAIAQLCDQGAKLIISVDCGITAVEQARLACERGVDLIVTDHHEWHANPESTVPVLPECYTVVHPRLPTVGEDYANPHLCGAGVAFKLAWGVGQAISGATRVSEEFRNYLIDATALAALGTIADVVPLVGENRVLAAFGLSGLQQSKLTGIQALIASAGLTGKKLDSYHVGFLLAPRLNACGRMGHARLAVEMLTAADERRAGEIADYLESQNRSRQTIEKQILAQAVEQVESTGMNDDSRRTIVLGGDDWHPGVIGIVASRIVERYNRPTVMIALSADGRGQGSGRSIVGFHLARALETCREHLDAFGGHEMAAGLKIQSDRLPAFREAFEDHARRVIQPEMLVPQLGIDCVAELRHLTPAMVAEFHRLGPFGNGNRKPLLCCRGVTLAGPPRRVGKTGDHLQLYIRQGQHFMPCIAFNRGELFDRLQPGITIDLAVEPTLNEYNGNTNVELEVKDLQFTAL